MIKMFASDLDGTLFNLLHQTDDVTRRAVQAALDQGVRVVPATGRIAPPSGEDGFGGLAVDAVCANGSIIRGVEGELLKTYPVDPVFVEDIIRTFPQICFDCNTPEGILSTGTHEQHQAGFKRDSLFRQILMRGMHASGKMTTMHLYEQPLSVIQEHEVCKINARIADPDLERELKAYIADHSDTVVNAPFNPVIFELTDKGCNKGESVAWLGRYYGIEEDEIAVYGDGGNDIVMLERFRHSYAVANAADAAKAAASETIGYSALHAVPKHMMRTLRKQSGRVIIS